MQDQNNKPLWNCYTYLIGCKEHNKFYYGVRYKKNCSPEDLWTIYFTSSNEVKKFRKEFGEPDIIEIRRTFGDNPIKAQQWERKVILRMKCVRDDKWLNLGCWGIDMVSSPEKRARSPECRRKISEKNRIYYNDPKNHEKAVKNAQEAGRKGREKISQKAKERYQDKEWFDNVFMPAHSSPEYRENLSKRTKELYAEGRMEKFYEKVKSQEYSDNMSRRMQEVRSDPEARKKNSEAQKARTQDPEIRKQMSERAKASNEKRLQSRKIMADLRAFVEAGGEITMEHAQMIGCNSIAMALNKIHSNKLSKERYQKKKTETSVQ